MNRKQLYLFAVTECLLVFPSAFVIAVAALRGMQPGQNEPARTSGIIFEWMTAHLTRADGAIVFLLFPAVALALGIHALWDSWTRNELFRWDAIAFGAVLRRNMHFLILTGGALAGAAIFMAALVHIITD